MYKYMEIKQHTPEQLMSQRRNQKEYIKENLKTNENGNTTYQNL